MFLLLAEAIAAAAEESGEANELVTGKYYTSFLTSATVTTLGSVVGGRRYYIPIFIPGAATFNRIGINMNTTATAEGATVRLSIYNSVEGVPTTVVADSGDTSIETTGNVEGTIDAELDGFYWLAAHFSDSGGTFHRMSPNFQLNSNFFGVDGAGTTGNTGYYETVAYGAADTAGTLVEYDRMPNLWLRSV